MKINAIIIICYDYYETSASGTNTIVVSTWIFYMQLPRYIRANLVKMRGNGTYPFVYLQSYIRAYLYLLVHAKVFIPMYIDWRIYTLYGIDTKTLARRHVICLCRVFFKHNRNNNYNEIMRLVAKVKFPWIRIIRALFRYHTLRFYSVRCLKFKAKFYWHYRQVDRYLKFKTGFILIAVTRRAM